jgi:hypothetical protein
VWNALLLNEHLEAFAHAFRIDQRLELQAGTGTRCLAHTMVIKVREVVSLPQGQQK